MQLFLRIPRVAEALRSCIIAHEKQKYGNLPYFTHPLQVAETIPNPTEDELVAALLHDTVEDTYFSIGYIRGRYGDNVANIVDLVTKDNELSYEENILRIINSGNISAIRVKWADNQVNMNNDKSGMTVERRHKLNKRYATSFMLLSSVLGI